MGWGLGGGGHSLIKAMQMLTSCQKSLIFSSKKKAGILQHLVKSHLVNATNLKPPGIITQKLTLNVISKQVPLSVTISQ